MRCRSCLSLLKGNTSTVYHRAYVAFCYLATRVKVLLSHNFVLHHHSYLLIVGVLQFLYKNLYVSSRVNIFVAAYAIPLYGFTLTLTYSGCIFIEKKEMKRSSWQIYML